jgi:hypothetical protein
VVAIQVISRVESGRQARGSGGPEDVFGWLLDDPWTTDPVFRHIWRVTTVMWGMGLLTDAALRVAMSCTRPIPGPQFLPGWYLL